MYTHPHMSRRKYVNNTEYFIEAFEIVLIAIGFYASYLLHTHCQ